MNDFSHVGLKSLGHLSFANSTYMLSKDYYYSAGVYIFSTEGFTDPVYVGSSINFPNRVLSHQLGLKSGTSGQVVLYNYIKSLPQGANGIN
jgi:hypothetical protein